MTLPADFQETIDWVNQPPPTNARDTHALHFWLLGPDPLTGGIGGPAFQGLMFYRPGAQPTSGIVQRQNGIEGHGYLMPTYPVCQQVVGPVLPRPPGPWVRVQVTWSTATDSPPRLFANLILKIENSNNNYLPGDPSEERRDLETFDLIQVHNFGLAMYPSQFTFAYGWQLLLTKTTVSL